MCYSKFSGKPNEMLEGGGLVMDLDPILGKGGEEEGNVRHSLSLHAKETEYKLEPDGPPGLSADFTIHLFILHYSLGEFRLSYTRSKEFFFLLLFCSSEGCNRQVSQAGKYILESEETLFSGFTCVARE